MITKRILKFKPYGVGDVRVHDFIRFKINLLSGSEFKHPNHLQPFVDCPTRNGNVSRMKYDVMGWLGHLEN